MAEVELNGVAAQPLEPVHTEVGALERRGHTWSVFRRRRHLSV